MGFDLFLNAVLNVCFESPNKGFSKTQIRVLVLFSNAGPECVFSKPEYGF